MNVTMNAIFYHGSPFKFTQLKAGSWVTPYKEDALVFGVQWDSNDLVDTGGKDGRPPKILKFKPGRKPENMLVHLYKLVEPKVVPAKTNTGSDYEWNRQVTEDALVEYLGQYVLD